MEKLKTLPLKDLPPDVDDMIDKEQHRLALFENKKLKKEQVVYHMLREWYKFKSVHTSHLETPKVKTA